MGFVEAVKSFYQRYFDFATRSSRSEYWWVALFQVLVMFVLMIPLMGALMSAGANLDSSDPMEIYSVFLGLSGLPILLFMLANIIPGIALAVRRIHDFDKTGWLYLIVIIGSMIPLLGLLVSIGWIVVNCLRGTVGPNRFGEDPVG